MTISLTEELTILKTHSSDDVLYRLRKIVGLTATNFRYN